MYMQRVGLSLLKHVWDIYAHRNFKYVNFSFLKTVIVWSHIIIGCSEQENEEKK